MAVSSAVWPCRGRAPRPCRSASRAPSCLARAVSRHRPTPAASVTMQNCIVTHCLPSLQYSKLSCNTVFLPSQKHTLAIQSTVLQYNFQPSSIPLCNTKMVLQYKFFFFTTVFSALSLAIQLQGLQYNFTIQLGSSPKTISALLFFFFHYNYYYYYYYFSFLSTGDTKIYIHFFFLQYIQ